MVAEAAAARREVVAAAAAAAAAAHKATAPFTLQSLTLFSLELSSPSLDLRRHHTGDLAKAVAI